MRKFVLLISIICFSATFAAAQKTVRKRSKTAFVQTSVGRTLPESNLKISEPSERPLKILDKPRPQVTDGQDCSQGKVVLRVTFLYTGKIGSISVISGLGNGATDNAIEAAKRIKFKPAVKNGKPVSVTKPVEYAFSIY